MRSWFETRYDDVESIVRDSGSSNTFRAFAHMPHKPSQVYYDWAEQMLSDDGVVEQITNLRSGAGVTLRAAGAGTGRPR